MGLWRKVVQSKAKFTSFRSYQFALLLAAALAVFAFYYFGSNHENFSSTTRRMKESQAGKGLQGDAQLVANLSEKKAAESLPSAAVVNGQTDNSVGDRTIQLHALMMFTKVDKNYALQEKITVAIKSMVKHAVLKDNEMLHLHFVSDAPSKKIGDPLLQKLLQGAAFKYQVTFHDVDAMTQKLFPVVEAMQKLFSAGSGAYYSDSIFFLSVAMHRIMPAELTRIVQLDLDLKYMSNIRDLFEEFDKFQPGAVIAIAREMQPVYRHTFWQYRQENPKTKVGDPPPDGLPGFNSGVMLLNLEAMRRSDLYNQLLDAEKVRKLAEEYHFKGHLGDQDFFTLIGMEHTELFHILDCTTNRQLCTWWRDHGYADVFDLYFKCNGKVKIYHGNCNTPIPDN
ncbi:LOW QUALITY PROTEIN: xyloside xylosyltransferase 1 [Pristis pectinata]|uniref:LOW QUALITY PROTEIN: xyloside xylosyltransferase 1 n=1 Tax=Pristis pectinata TaxID=685728 RepID=UPI00223D9D3F|nr:LOW QUALITY PROTEIN: xyloside xylosyltransferase 1 [Pristis pectinata]